MRFVDHDHGVGLHRIGAGIDDGDIGDDACVGSRVVCARAGGSKREDSAMRNSGRREVEIMRGVYSGGLSDGCTF